MHSHNDQWEHPLWGSCGFDFFLLLSKWCHNYLWVNRGWKYIFFGCFKCKYSCEFDEEALGAFPRWCVKERAFTTDTSRCSPPEVLWVWIDSSVWGSRWSTNLDVDTRGDDIWYSRNDASPPHTRCVLSKGALSEWDLRRDTSIPWWLDDFGDAGNMTLWGCTKCDQWYIVHD